MLAERKNEYGFGKIKWTLVGPKIAVGEKAPDFTLTGKDFQPVTLNDSKGKVRVLASIQSLDTQICDSEIRHFNDKIKAYPNDVVVLAISMDLPYAQQRWCEANLIKNVTTASDYLHREFGDKYGVRVKETGLLARAVFVVDRNNKIVYAEYMPELTKLPNFEAALEAVKKAVKG